MDALVFLPHAVIQIHLLRFHVFWEPNEKMDRQVYFNMLASLSSTVATLIIRRSVKDLDSVACSF